MAAEQTTVDSEALVEADCQLSEVLEALEAIDWSTVPKFTTAEAAALAARLREAREAARDGAEVSFDGE